MTQYRSSSRRRLAVAVSAVLAVTAGTAVVTTPATAAPVAVVQGAAQADAVITLPHNAQIVSAGNTGFLIRSLYPSGTEYRWTNYADGSTKLLDPRGTDYYGSQMSDIVVSRQQTQSTYWLHDMAAPGSSPTGLSFGDQRYTPQGIVDGTLVMTYVNSSGVLDVVLMSKASGSSSSPTTRRVTGIPGNARVTHVSGTTPGTALLTYRIETQYYLAAVDLATGSILDQRTTSTQQADSPAFLSASHWAWIERPTATTVQLVTAARGEGQQPTVTPLGAGAGPLAVHLLGDWATYSMTGGNDAFAPSALHPLTARSLTDPTRTIKLLDHVHSSTVSPDGSLLVRGGTVAEGEGIYRIAPGGDGTPVATLVASTGVPTSLALTSSNVPSVIDLDKSGDTQLGWTLSRPNATATVTLRHVRTGKTAQMQTERMDELPWRWQGELGIDVAPNGDYVWEVAAKPMNGIGPDLRTSGTFKVVRKAALHDYDDNGAPDLLVRDSAGRLWKDEVRKTWSSDSYWSVGSKLAGSGWNIYQQIESVGNVGGAPAADLVARDKDGVLWLYLGKGDGTFAPRQRLGAGWNVYNKLAGGSDLNGDGTSDLLATDGSGGLWLYKGTGNWAAPFAARVRIGTGWQIYNQITSVGDIGGTAAGDLLARDTSGVLWLYQGNGSGSFIGRVRLGAGWGAYTHLVGMGDADRDGRNDLFAYGSGGSYVYPGTGSATAPFGPRVGSSIYPATTTPYNPVV
ncbi:VCBS repeat-containing protein [Streptomyces sp. ISL-36]|uniref:FG-GAP repeat domain-containing protein n=1 Tax=Streptomyces sp. ISL-36 TaxID=2819182 RepID=UPI001BE750F0|nr:VCBS repeat-containing protein [Streptomyces sp. ISL-36]MBT2443938.1 VCBS repeat-containing protein [Streptomyces sp. ISL-36]